MASAYSSELPYYGVKQGLTNYAACYCTGLLVARRMLTKIGLDKDYKGNTSVGKFFHNEDEETEKRRSFRCFLDIGLNRSTTGANVFGALKGAVDGGLNIPYTGNRLASGYMNRKEDKDGSNVNEAALSDRIYAQHVASYMRELADDKEALQRQFSVYLKNNVQPDDIKGIYEKAHEKIRQDPMPKRQPDPRHDKKARKERREKKRAERKARIDKRAQEKAKKIA